MCKDKTICDHSKSATLRSSFATLSQKKEIFAWGTVPWHTPFMKMKKRNDMGVRVYGCMPNGGEERKRRPHKKTMFLVWAQ